MPLADPTPLPAAGSQLVHCIYASAAVRRFDTPELTELLRRARVANLAAGLTGMLLHVDGSFFQILEGEASRVETLYAKLLLDPRHRRVTRIIQEPIRRRTFGSWTMGFADVPRSALGSVEGINDFFDGGTALSTLDGGRAKKLLAVFAAGRWRQSQAPIVPGSRA